MADLGDVQVPVGAQPQHVDKAVEAVADPARRYPGHGGGRPVHGRVEPLRAAPPVPGAEAGTRRVGLLAHADRNAWQADAGRDGTGTFALVHMFALPVLTECRGSGVQVRQATAR